MSISLKKEPENVATIYGVWQHFLSSTLAGCSSFKKSKLSWFSWFFPDGLYAIFMIFCIFWIFSFIFKRSWIKHFLNFFLVSLSHFKCFPFDTSNISITIYLEMTLFCAAIYEFSWLLQYLEITCDG